MAAVAIRKKGDRASGQVVLLEEIGLKRREIRFDSQSPGAEPASAAVELLSDFEPVVEITQQGRHSVAIVYDLRKVSLSEIERALVELGFGLDAGLLSTIKRAVWRYSEEVERENLSRLPRRGLAGDAQAVSISRYLRHRHGCRDDRPKHWREYL